MEAHHPRTITRLGVQAMQNGRNLRSRRLCESYFISRVIFLLFRCTYIILYSDASYFSGDAQLDRDLSFF